MSNSKISNPTTITKGADKETPCLHSGSLLQPNLWQLQWSHIIVFQVHILMDRSVPILFNCICRWHHCLYFLLFYFFTNFHLSILVRKYSIKIVWSTESMFERRQKLSYWRGRLCGNQPEALVLFMTSQWADMIFRTHWEVHEVHEKVKVEYKSWVHCQYRGTGVLDGMDLPEENILDASSHLLQTNFFRLLTGGGGWCDRLKHPGLPHVWAAPQK